MSSSDSQSNPSSTSTVSTVTDSYKQTENYVSNLSDVGNVKLNFGSQDGGGSVKDLIPIMGIAFIGLLGVVFIVKR